MKISLTVTAGPHVGTTFEFDRYDTFVVGRSPEADFRLPKADRHFSRMHFLVEVNPPHSAVREAVGLICQTLEYAHANGFVHCDVKPANLLVTAEKGQDFVRLADFGLALVYGSSSMSGLSLTGQRAGTIPFMAPEQITNFRDVNPATDQHAIAATLYRLLTKRYLYDFPRGTSERLGMILSNDPLPIRERRAEIPQKLAAVIHRALSRSPKARFADMGELRAALVESAKKEHSVK